MAIDDNNQMTLDELQAVMENYPVADRSMMPRKPAAPVAPAAPAPAAPAGPPTNADRLAEAEVAGNKQQLMADLLRTFQGAIASSAPTSGYKADYAIADGISKRAGQGLENTRAQIKQEAADKVAAQEAEKHQLFMKDAMNKLALQNIQVQDTKDAHDPNSKISKASREIFKEYLKMQGKPYDERSVAALSGDDVMKMMPDMQKIGFEYFKAAQTDKQNAVTNTRNAALDAEAKRKTNLDEKFRRDEMKQNKDMAEMKDKTANAKIESDELKADKKEKAKENQAIHKENRKLRTELDKAEGTVDAQIKMMEEAKKKFIAYSKKSPGGTGPLATLGGATTLVSQPTEAMNSTFKNISFDTLIKSFQGMSKAVDSDAERRAFESTQPSITQDDKTNMMLLDQRINALKSLKQKTAAAKAKYDRDGRFTDDDPAPEKEMTDHDKQALAWANANLADPRAVEIKKRLGQ